MSDSYSGPPQTAILCQEFDGKWNAAPTRGLDYVGFQVCWRDTGKDVVRDSFATSDLGESHQTAARLAWLDLGPVNEYGASHL